jgi:hypothetical protein
MALRALARLELVGAGPVAFFEGFHKPADIGVSSLSSLQTDAARHPSAVGTGHYPGPSLAIGVIVRHEASLAEATSLDIAGKTASDPRDVSRSGLPGRPLPLGTLFRLPPG